jgi:hypothetical protein
MVTVVELAEAALSADDAVLPKMSVLTTTICTAVVCWLVFSVSPPPNAKLADSSKMMKTAIRLIKDRRAGHRKDSGFQPSGVFSCCGFRHLAKM